MNGYGITATPTQVRPLRSARAQRPQSGVVIYGNRWCGLTQMTARTLSRAGVAYEYVDLDEHPAIEQRLRQLAGGRLRTPVVYVDGRWLVAPSPGQLRAALTATGVAA